MEQKETDPKIDFHLEVELQIPVLKQVCQDVVSK